MAIEPIKLAGETYVDKAVVDRLIEEYLRSEGAISDDCVVTEITGDNGKYGDEPVQGFRIRIERAPDAGKQH